MYGYSIVIRPLLSSESFADISQMCSGREVAISEIDFLFPPTPDGFPLSPMSVLSLISSSV